MIKFRYFYILPSIQKEIENALLETIDYPMDDRLRSNHLNLKKDI